MSPIVIEAKGLTKSYGRHKAVDGVELTVSEGEVVGLLGPNGAGKTTTILMLLGLTEADSGTVRILGRDPWREPLQVKREVGYLPDAVGFYDNLSGRENLRYTARLGGLSAEEAERRITEVLEKVRLAQVGDRRVAGVVDQLDTDSREVLLMRYVDGFSPKEIAEVRGETANAVSVRLNRAVKKVQELIHAKG